MSPASPQIVPLRVRAEVGTEKRMFTFAAPFRIGRTDDCEVSIKNEHVSRRHAEVVFDNGNWLVRVSSESDARSIQPGRSDVLFPFLAQN